MRNSLLSVILGVLSLLSAAGASAQGGPQLAAPLPAAVTSAKTIFISDAGNNSVVYVAFSEGMRDWGKYEIVASADAADLIVELSYFDSHRDRSWNGNTFLSTHSRAQKKDSKVIVTFYDSRTNEPLWSASEPQKRAKREKNREREAIQSVQHLIGDLKMREVAPE